MQHSGLAILILEDNDAVVSRLHSIFATWPKAGQVFACLTLNDAMARLANTEINLLLADVDLPDGNGIDAIRFLSQQQHSSVSMVLSALSQRPTVIEAITAGATGYLLKDDEDYEILDACQRVLDGHSPLSSSIARLIIDQIRPPSDAQRSSSNPDHQLTPRELQVLTMIARGSSYLEVASALSLSISTVQSHIRNLYRKLQVNNRSEASFAATKLGILHD